MPDLPTCAHDVTLPPPGQESWCPTCLRNELAGYKKAYALMEAGMASQCELMDAMKQQARGDAEEITRLKAGRFTPEELQGLCHALSADDACAFVRGCRAYQLQLFGRDKVKAALDRTRSEWMERNRCPGCGCYPDPWGEVEHLRRCSPTVTNVEELAP